MATAEKHLAREERVLIAVRKQTLKVEGADAKSAMIFGSETFFASQPICQSLAQPCPPHKCRKASRTPHSRWYPARVISNDRVVALCTEARHRAEKVCA
jgi:hypothetical protein